MRASVIIRHRQRLPGVLQTNVGHSKFGYRKIKKIIRSDINTLSGLLVEAVESEMVGF